MLQSNAGISPKNGEHINMGGPCRTVGTREADSDSGREVAGPIDEIAAAKSLSLYCKPVELYNIIRSRANLRPVFLQRCLNYKIHSLRQKRMKMTVQVRGNVNSADLSLWNKKKLCMDPGPSTAGHHQFLPFFVMVTNERSCQQEQLVGTKEIFVKTQMFDLSKVVKVVMVPMLDSSTLSDPVSFVLPELTKLFVHAKNGDVILFCAFVDPAEVMDAEHQELRELVDCSGPVVWGKLSMASLCTQWLRNVHGGASLIGLNGVSVETVCSLDFALGKLQHLDTALGPMILMRGFRGIPVECRSELKLHVHILTGDSGQSPVSGQAPNGAHLKRSPSSFTQGFRNHRGCVEFHYLYYFNRCEKIEEILTARNLGCLRTIDSSNAIPVVTEEFSCPFCLVRCSTFKGLRCHLNCSHDLFNFEYSPNADIPVVNVTCRTDLLGPEGNIRELEADLRTKNWIFWSRRPFGCIVARMGGLPKAHPPRGEGGYLPGRIGRDLLDGHIEPDPVNGGDQNLRVHRLQKQRVRGEKRDGMMLFANAEGSLPMKRQRLEGCTPEEEDLHGGVCAAAAAPPLEEIGLPLISATSARPRAERNRQVAAERAERAEARKRLLLQRRPFFHSHTAQPMAPEQLLSDRDSEDELDEDLAVLEDRRMLDDFVDVSADEKEVMHLWNSFVRKQRVLADGHCQWACEAFSKLHAQHFSSRLSLRRCLMLFLLKLWNHHLVDGATIDKCLNIVDSQAPTNEANPSIEA